VKEVPTRKRTARKQTDSLGLQRQRLEHLRPLLAQAASSLLRGIIIESRTVPSIVVRFRDETVPMDAEEDIEPKDIVEEV
jgi:hypothetical protein